MGTVIPTLGDDLFLTEPNVQLTYVLRTFSIFPDNTMPFLNDKMPSLAALAAEYGHNRDLLCPRIQEAVLTLLKSTFPTGSPTVTVNGVESDAGDYAVTIRVTLNLAGNVMSEAARATIKNGMVTIPNDQVSLT